MPVVFMKAIGDSHADVASKSIPNSYIKFSTIAFTDSQCYVVIAT